MPTLLLQISIADGACVQTCRVERRGITYMIRCGGGYKGNSPVDGAEFGQLHGTRTGSSVERYGPTVDRFAGAQDQTGPQRC